MNVEDSVVIRIGKMTAYPSRNELIAGSNSLRVQPKVMAVLSYLSDKYPEVVSNEELIEHVWTGRVVTHSSVQKSINFLRKAIAELVGDQVYIEHYSKKGYQLVIAPEYLSAAGQPPDTQRIHNPLRRGFELGVKNVLLVMIIALVGISAVWVAANQERWVWRQSHAIVFDSEQEITLPLDAIATLAVHPDNQHIAMVDKASSAYRLVVRQQDGQVWSVAQSANPWSLPVWSPNGRFLAVVERDLADGADTGVPFYGHRQSLLTVHIFEIDLDNRVLLDKHRLSHWYGDIHSVTWWKNDVLELVAQRGSNAERYRFRYGFLTQNLQQVPVHESITNPLRSAVSESYTALLSPAEGGLQLDFLDKQQQRFQSFFIAAQSAVDTQNTNIHWLPDASGVLVEAAGGNWSLYYRDGKQQSLPQVHSHSNNSKMPRYSADGQSLYYIARQPVASLWASGHTRSQPLVTGLEPNAAALWHPEGTSFVFTLRHNAQSQLWYRQLATGAEAQLLYKRTDQPIKHLRWHQNGQALLFTVGDEILNLTLATGSVERLVQAPGIERALTLTGDAEQIMAVRETAGVSNIWLYQAGTAQWAQLTFGDLASVLVSSSGAVYFQHVDQEGVWQLTATGESQRVLASTVPANSRLLWSDDTSLHYIAGRVCRESAVFSIDIATGGQAELWPASAGRTHSYLPSIGQLYDDCAAPMTGLHTLFNKT